MKPSENSIRHLHPFHVPIARRQAMEEFLKGRHRERAWMLTHPEVPVYQRLLTDGECLTLGMLPGSRLLGKRAATGGFEWCLAAVEDTSHRDAEHN